MALAVAEALFVHLMVPEYAVPTVADAGSPVKSGTMSDAVVFSVVVAVLLAAFPSLVAPVVPVSVDEPGTVGVPETVQVITPPAATLAGGAGEQDVVRPAGRPEIEQVAAAAVSAGEAALVQVNVPL